MRGLSWNQISTLIVTKGGKTSWKNWKVGKFNVGKVEVGNLSLKLGKIFELYQRVQYDLSRMGKTFKQIKIVVKWRKSKILS